MQDWKDSLHMSLLVIKLKTLKDKTILWQREKNKFLQEEFKLVDGKLELFF